MRSQKINKRYGFACNNLTRNCSDWFSVKKVGGSYESGNSAIGGCIWDMKIGTGIEFNFGGFRVKFDDKNNQLNLYDGDFRSTLLLENCDYPTVIPGATVLRINTLIAKKVIFKNEGVLETFVTILQDCLTVENKGEISCAQPVPFQNTYPKLRYGSVGRCV